MTQLIRESVRRLIQLRRVNLSSPNLYLKLRKGTRTMYAIRQSRGEPRQTVIISKPTLKEIREH